MKQTKAQIFRTVCRFQGNPDIAGMALICGEGRAAARAAGHFLLSRASDPTAVFDEKP